jgi:hypothetical protein
VSAAFPIELRRLWCKMRFGLHNTRRAANFKVRCTFSGTRNTTSDSLHFARQTCHAWRALCAVYDLTKAAHLRAFFTVKAQSCETRSKSFKAKIIVSQFSSSPRSNFRFPGFPFLRAECTIIFTRGWCRILKFSVLYTEPLAWVLPLEHGVCARHFLLESNIKSGEDDLRALMWSVSGIRAAQVVAFFEQMRRRTRESLCYIYIFPRVILCTIWCSALPVVLFTRPRTKLLFSRFISQRRAVFLLPCERARARKVFLITLLFNLPVQFLDTCTFTFASFALRTFMSSKKLFHTFPNSAEPDATSL